MKHAVSLACGTSNESSCDSPLHSFFRSLFLDNDDSEEEDIADTRSVNETHVFEVPIRV